MFRSFFPAPKLFFLSVVWAVIAFVVWFTVGDKMGVMNLGANLTRPLAKVAERRSCHRTKPGSISLWSCLPWCSA